MRMTTIAAGAGISPGGGGSFNGPAGVLGLPAPINTIGQVQSLACILVDWIFWGLLILAVVFALISAYRYATSSGDPEKVHSAGRTLLFAVVAIVVALLAGGLPSLIGSFFYVPYLSGCTIFFF